MGKNLLFLRIAVPLTMAVISIPLYVAVALKLILWLNNN